MPMRKMKEEYLTADDESTYEDPEKAAAEPTEARRATAENFMIDFIWKGWTNCEFQTQEARLVANRSPAKIPKVVLGIRP